MKKFLCILFCISLIFSLTACKEKDSVNTNSYDTVTNEPIENNREPATESSDIDVDLTVLSGNMLYSQVYNIVMSPDEYIGKTIKIEGTFSHFYDEEKDKDYYACIIQDATACCSQGIEFIPTDEYAHPEEKYGEGEAIAVTGVLDSYKEDGYDYLTLKEAKLL